MRCQVPVDPFVARYAVFGMASSFSRRWQRQLSSAHRRRVRKHQSIAKAFMASEAPAWEGARIAPASLVSTGGTVNAGRGLCAASWTRAAGMACRALPTCLGAAGGRRGLSRRKGSEMADPQIQTEEYIEEHGLRQLFQDMTAHLIFYKPEDPYDAMVKFLTHAREMGTEPLLNTKDLETMFGMFDVTRRRTITMKQAREALRTVLGPEADFPDSANTPDDTLFRVQEFVQRMSAALKAALPFTRNK